jgi:hypothetical protein
MRGRRAHACFCPWDRAITGNQDASGHVRPAVGRCRGLFAFGGAGWTPLEFTVPICLSVFASGAQAFVTTSAGLPELGAPAAGPNGVR